MSKPFALFLLENANNGNEILQVLDVIVEVEYTPLKLLETVWAG